jgi:hypothetical protein
LSRPCTRTSLRLAHVTVFNPQRANTVEVDLSTLALAHGDYLLRSATNIQEWQRFTYDGSAVAVNLLPTRWTVAKPVGAEERAVPV